MLYEASGIAKLLDPALKQLEDLNLSRNPNILERSKENTGGKNLVKELEKGKSQSSEDERQNR